MNVHLYFTTGNAAFADGALPLEAARIFREHADRIEPADSLTDYRSAVMDVNGNRVGMLIATDDEETPDIDRPYLLASLDTGNAAFEEMPGVEVARILRAAAAKLEDGDLDFGLRDINGNRVGAVLVQAEEPAADLDNDGGEGGESPRDPLLGDGLVARDGAPWTLVRVELVNNRKGLAQRMEPLYILANDDDPSEFQFLFSEQLQAVFGSETKRKFGYVIDVEERGEFVADVRQEDGTSVFEVRNAQGEDESDLVQDGYMKHFRDIDGLAEYLQDTMGVMLSNDELLSGSDFYKYMAEITELSLEGAAAWERHNAPQWYGYASVADESVGDFLRSVGATVGEYNAADGIYWVKLGAEAKAAVEEMASSITLHVRPITALECAMNPAGMSDETLRAYNASRVAIALHGVEGGDAVAAAREQGELARAEILRRGPPAPTNGPDAAPSP